MSRATLIFGFLLCLAMGGFTPRLLAGCCGHARASAPVADSAVADGAANAIHHGCAPGCQGCGCGCRHQPSPENPGLRALPGSPWPEAPSPVLVASLLAVDLRALDDEPERRRARPRGPPGRLGRHGLIFHEAILPLRR